MSNSLHEFKSSEFSNSEKIGELGQFGQVFKKSHEHFQNVAVRIISKRYISQTEKDRRLIEEAQNLFAITSEHVIRLLGIVKDDVLGLVFEYAEFGPLNKFIIRCKLGWPLKLRIANDIAMGMSFLHSKNILHLRLKCRNILLKDNLCAKVSDVFFHHTRKFCTWSTIASQSTAVDPSFRRSESTVAHIPPECLNDINLPPNESWDVYAYSIILWELMTERKPYEGERQQDLCRKIAEGLRPDMSLVPHDRPDVLQQIMDACLQASDLRPDFATVIEQLRTAVESSQHEARDMALNCQKEALEYYFRDKAWGPPLGDLLGSMGGFSSNTNRSENPSPLREPTVPMAESSEKMRLSSSAHHAPTQHHVETPQQKNDATPIRPDDVSSRLVNADDMYKIARSVGRYYREFGQNLLNLSDNNIDLLEEHYQSSGPYEIAYQMIRCWKETLLAPLTLSYMFRLLKSNGYSEVADNLAAR